ncbi:BrxA family protein [Metalysinibacillus jejuensis]|uniref:BrxA family protein n=1 Tax=Metalysinibacillus jejuensis TaxID=914327 RepID=UPI00137B7F0E|nr:BrxA family protein [Metalysinibacillus jejuensis]
MKQTIDNDNYDTAINIIGGLKDLNVIYKAFDSYFNESDTLHDLIHKRNEFNIRTEKSRKRIESAVVKTFLQFKNEDHRDLIQGVCNEFIPQQDKALLMIWQFALNNRLFREITKDVFMKIYYSGRLTITKNDIVSYLKELLLQKQSLNLNWSEITIDTLSTKYLNIMTKLGVLNTGRIKTFKNIHPSTEAQVLFIYFLKLKEPENYNILTNEFLSIGFIHPDDLQERIKKLALKGFFNMNFNGIKLNVELTHSHKGVCYDLYN